MASATADCMPPRKSQQKPCSARSTAARSSASRAASPSGTAPSGTEIRKLELTVGVLHEKLHARLGARELGTGRAQSLDPFFEQLEGRLQLEPVALQLGDDLLQPGYGLLESH